MSTDAPDPRFTRHVSKAWPGHTELFAAGEAIEQLVSSFGWAVLHDVLDREVQAVDAKLDGTTEPLSQAEYAMLHGQRAGLKSARAAAEAILSKYQAALDEQTAKHDPHAGE